MADAGYVNGYFGKYMNGLAEQPGYVAPGWDRWVALTDAESQFNVDGDVSRIDTDTVLADQFSADHCDDFLLDHAGHPWFAVFAPTARTTRTRPARSTSTTSTTSRGTRRRSTRRT